ncbi:MAG: MFS transporter [Chloroflexi bacterium]|nr:MFS transporter [Chloroflexota bacterium]
MKISQSLRKLPRNVWALSLTSFFNDISSDMVIHILPLFLSNVLNVKTNLIGLIEGVAESTASLLKVFFGWYSDRLGKRKWVAVAGYGISVLSRPFYYFASSWGVVAGVRWADRFGKGVRTAPRDALLADSVNPKNRGLAFGFHRAADTAGALIGLLVALFVVWRLQAATIALSLETFQMIVLLSLIPAVLGVVVLAFAARDVSAEQKIDAPQISFRRLGKKFAVFLLIVGIFDLGNSSDAFLILRAQERGLSVLGILGMLAVFNLVFTLLSTPAGALSDRVGRRRILIGGWLSYAAIYFGFGMAGNVWHIWALYVLYGVYYGLAFSTAKAMVADLVPAELRGTAYGTYNAVLGIIDLPASIIAGILWEGLGGWEGFGPSAPFYFGAVMALLATVGLMLWRPNLQGDNLKVVRSP